MTLRRNIVILKDLSGGTGTPLSRAEPRDAGTLELGVALSARAANIFAGRTNRIVRTIDNKREAFLK